MATMQTKQTNERATTDRRSDSLRGLWEVLSSSSELAIARSTGKMTDEEANARIEIWQHGRTVGRREQQEEVEKVLNKTFVENMGSSASLAYKIIDALSEMSYKVYDVFIRIDDGLFHYEMLIVVDEGAFVTDEFDGIYDKIYILKQEVGTDTFTPSVHFLPAKVADTTVELYNLGALYGDGYIYRLSEKSEA